ncbi:MAG TPA: YdcF family protein, partial [Asticcacaulis sp.]|nr:YdcF family protein [Asticcacaulis sp.]
VLIGFGPAPAALLSATQATNRLSDVVWNEKNSIVLLGAGTVAKSAGSGPEVPIFGYGRVAATANAWRDCQAHGKDCDIIVSGGDPQRHGETEAAVYSRELLTLGVPQSALTLETRSQNTWQNAQYSTGIIPADRQIVVVTSGLHLKRSLLYFRYFRAGAEGVAGDRLEPSFGPFQSGYNFFVTDALLHEQIGIGRYYVYNALGLNARPAPKG